jgi:hypothetical protein
LDQADAIADEDEDDGTGGKLDKLLKDTRAELGSGGGSKPPKPPKKTGGGGSKEPDDKKEPKKQTFGSFKKKADEKGGRSPFIKGEFVPGNLREVIGEEIAVVYDNSLQVTAEDIDFANTDPNYPTTKETEEQIENYALKSVLYARQLERDPSRGAGTKMLSYDELQALKANEDRNINGFGNGTPEMVSRLVRASRPLKFTDEFVESTWQMVKGAFQKSGGLPSGYGDYEAGLVTGKNLPKSIYYTAPGDDGPKIHKPKPTFRDKKPNGEFTAAYKKKVKDYDEYMKQLKELEADEKRKAVDGDGGSRAKIMWKLFLEQGGRDAFTGLALNISDMQLEHVLGFQGSGDKANRRDSAEKKLQRVQERDTDKNFVLINKSVNNQKSDKSMEEFYATNVRPYYSITQTDFDFVGQSTSARDEMKDKFLTQTLPSILDDNGNIRSMDNLDQFITEMDEYETKLNDMSQEILSQAIKPKKPSKGSLPKKPTTQKRGESDQEFAKRQQEYKAAVEKFDDDMTEYEEKLKDYTPRANWLKKNAGSLRSSNDTLIRETAKKMNLGVSWSRKGSEESAGDRGGLGPSPDTIKTFIKKMSQDKKIMEPGRQDAYRKLWKTAIAAGKASSGTGVKEFVKVLEDAGYSPD